MVTAAGTNNDGAVTLEVAALGGLSTPGALTGVFTTTPAASDGARGEGDEATRDAGAGTSAVRPARRNNANGGTGTA